MLDAVDRGIKAFFARISDNWTSIDYDELGSVENDAIHRLCDAEMLQIESEDRVIRESESEGLLAKVHLTGPYQDQDIFIEVAKAFPTDWLSEDGRLKAKSAFYVDPLRVRLTTDGAIARQHLLDENDTFVLGWLRNKFVERRQGKCSVELVESKLFCVKPHLDNVADVAQQSNDVRQASIEANE